MSGLPDELPKGKERQLKRDTALLQEFDDSESADLLVLYHHLRDRSFDCFNAAEYTAQMLKYYTANIRVVEIVSRKIRDNNYFLVCLRSEQQSANPVLCEMAFQCMRQFAGFTMLVKRRCFVCNAPNAKMCKGCQCASFCSKECLAAGWKAHRKLCKKVDITTLVIDKEQLELKLSWFIKNRDIVLCVGTCNNTLRRLGILQEYINTVLQDVPTCRYI